MKAKAIEKELLAIQEELAHTEDPVQKQKLEELLIIGYDELLEKETS
ncbi:MAG: hypothetical protein AAFY41_18020 [Bacteroidota bacterium]